MKIKMICDVEPKIKANTLRGIYSEWQYDFTSNDDGFLEKITIETTVPDYTKYQMRFEPYPQPETPDGKILVFLMDEDFNNLLIEEFQYFEGMISLLGNPATILWQSPWIELIAENEEEKPHAIGGFRAQRVTDEEKTFELSDNNVGNMIMRVHFHSKIMNPYLAFFREAERERRAFRFINTFFNSYFVLEGAYGNQKWRNWEVTEEFKNSSDFRKCAQKVIDNFVAKNPLIETKIRKMLSELKDRRGNLINPSLDIDGIAELLVLTRGSLLHFSGDTETSKGTPINHNEFEEIAEVAIRIAGETLWEFSQQIDDYLEKQKDAR
jgi:hypothetical protein